MKFPTTYMVAVTNEILLKLWISIINFLPQFFLGLLILLIGYILTKVVNKFINLFFIFFKVDEIFIKLRLIEKKQIDIWKNILIELIKWLIFLTFLMTSMEIWGLSKAVNFINQIISFFPNIIIVILIAFLGVISSNFLTKIILQAIPRSKEKNTITLFIQIIITLFTFLVILNQIGVAKELIAILFAGIVFMFALAGGLAFGLGGKEIAQEILTYLKEKINHS